jgi:hypothetical protein
VCFMGRKAYTAISCAPIAGSMGAAHRSTLGCGHCSGMGISEAPPARECPREWPVPCGSTQHGRAISPPAAPKASASIKRSAQSDRCRRTGSTQTARALTSTIAILLGESLFHYTRKKSQLGYSLVTVWLQSQSGSDVRCKPSWTMALAPGTRACPVVDPVRIELGVGRHTPEFHQSEHSIQHAAAV